MGSFRSIDALLASARQDTGLEDFGDERFLEGLTRLVDALASEARLSALGERFMTERLHLHLCQRLRVESWYRRHPEIAEVPIVAPLIGVSLPRTGSTALSFLLAEDPRARSLRAHESPRPAEAIDEVSPRSIDGASARPPGAQHFVPRGDNPPAECQELMALDFRSQLFLAFAQVPSYADWLMDADLTSTYEYEKRVLRLLQWRRPVARWRLKAPTHLLYLDAIDRAFPDARFVMTHRDPAAVMPSVCALYAEYVGKLTDHLDRRYIGDLNLRQWSTGMQRAIRFRDEGRAERFFDIHFRDMQQDPVGAVRGLYEWLDEPLEPAFERGMSDWWQAQARGEESGRYPDAASFGLDADRIDAAFGEYRLRMQQWTGRGAD